MPNVECNGVTIEYEIRGEGEPILFIMGLGGQMIDWPDEFVDMFVDEGYQIIRFDNRDVGLSTKESWTPPSQARSAMAMFTRRALKGVGYTVPDMADDAASLLDALGIESAHVVGVSMGGMIAQELTINHPTKVRSLCSVMSHTGDRKNGGIAFSVLSKIRHFEPGNRETAVDQAVEAFTLISGDAFDADEYRLRVERSVARDYSPAGALRQSAAISGSPDRTGRLLQLDVPTLVVHGLQDPLVKPSGGVATAKAVPGARLLMFPDMGHDLPRSRWIEMRDAMLANFRRVGVPVG